MVPKLHFMPWGASSAWDGQDMNGKRVIRNVARALALSAALLWGAPSAHAGGPAELTKVLSEITRITQAGKAAETTALIVEGSRITEAAELFGESPARSLDFGKLKSAAGCLGTADDAVAALCDVSRDIERVATESASSGPIEGVVKEAEEAAGEVTGEAVAELAESVKLGEDGKLIPPEGVQVVRVGEDAEIWVQGSQLSDDAIRELESIGRSEADLTQESERIARVCGGDVKCVADELKAAASKPWLRKLLESTCLGRNPDALVSTLYGLGVSLTAFGTGYALTPKDEDSEFPFDILAHTVLITFVYGNMACVNTIERPATGSDGEPGPYYTRENLKRGYIAYLKYTPIQVGALVALSAGEEAIRGRNPFDAEGLKRIGMDSAFGLLYGATILGPRSVGWIMPMYYRWLPSWGRSATAAMRMRMGRLVGERLQRTFLFGAVALAPSIALNVGGRVTNESAERWLFMNLREHFVPSSDEGDASASEPPEPPETPDTSEAQADPETGGDSEIQAPSEPGPDVESVDSSTEPVKTPESS